ncbi:MAG: hypothetical protein V2A69_14890 [Pseudomonadota bacterium]
MGVHEADFPTEERSAFNSLKVVLRTTPVLHWAVEQPGAVRPEQVCFDDPQMLLSLVRSQKIIDDGVDYR